MRIRNDRGIGSSQDQGVTVIERPSVLIVGCGGPDDRAIVSSLSASATSLRVVEDASDLSAALESDARPDVLVACPHPPGIDTGALASVAHRSERDYLGLLVQTEPSTEALSAALEAGADDAVDERAAPDLIAARVSSVARTGALHRTMARDREALERELEHLSAEARTDPVTGMRNRRALDEMLPVVSGRMDRYAETWALVLLDIDRFKEFNDERGHAAGDELLRRFGRLLEANLRVVDAAFRYGGDEFLLLLAAPPTRKIEAVLVRLKQAIRTEAIEHPGNPPWGRVTFSGGYAVRRGRDGIVDWIEQADRALYEAKRGGRNQLVPAAPAAGSRGRSDRRQAPAAKR